MERRALISPMAINTFDYPYHIAFLKMIFPFALTVGLVNSLSYLIGGEAININLPWILILLGIPVLLMSLITGVRLAFAHIFLDVTVETAPPGWHTIYHYALRPDDLITNFVRS